MKRILFVCSLFLFFAFIVSCERTLVLKEPALSVQEQSEEMKALTDIAKQYYTKELRKTIETGQMAALKRAQGMKKMSAATESGDSDGGKTYALWNKAVTVTVDGVSRTEVPLSYSSRTVSLIKVARDSVGEQPDRSMLSTIFDRLVVFHDRDGLRQKIVRFHPDKSYLKRHGFDASHNYLHRLDEDFSGYLEYLEISGERKAIIRVVDGKPVRKFGMGSRQIRNSARTISPNGSAGVMSEGWECFDVCEDIWGEICVGNPFNPDDPNDVYCEVQWLGQKCEEECFPTGEEWPEPDYCDDPANWEECWGDPEPEPEEPTPPSETAVKNQIANKPFALMPSNIPCPIIQQWLATAIHTAAQTHIDKLNTIRVTVPVPFTGLTTTTIASLQNINDAYSTTVNLDYFPVTVSQLPEINGQTVTPDQFLTHIRTNLNDFVDSDKAEFEPYNWYGIDETVLWNSPNPSGAVIGIDIKGPDNGSVIVTHSSGDKWTFSTIFDPRYGQHPVSGNRDFGYVDNGNGTYTFYTRGVDRLTHWGTNFIQELNSSLLTPFGESDALWRSFQDKIEEFVNNNQGNASAANEQIYRPDWQQVKDVLDGKAHLSTLSKDCPD